MSPVELSTDIDVLYEQMQSLPEFENDSCRNSFEGQLAKIRQLHDFNDVRQYRIVFIGEPGMGKTTAICNWLGLLRTDKTKAKRIDNVSLLATASGRTTVAEVHIRQVPDTSCLRMEYLPIEQQEAYIQQYCTDYYNRCFSVDTVQEEDDASDTTKADAYAEMDRVVRNMAGLKEYPAKADSDPAKARRSAIEAFMRRFADADAFYKYVLEKIDLASRQRDKIEKPSGADFEEWLSGTFKEINDGKRGDCSITSTIYVDVSIQDLDLLLPSIVTEIIDTKGLDSPAAARPDLQDLMRAEDTICFLMDDVKGVPSDNVRNLLKRTFLSEWDVYYKYKTSIFVKSPENELAGVNGAEDDPELGKDCKANEVERKVRANGIPYLVDNTLFLDSCAAYVISTEKEPVLDEDGKPLLLRNGKPKTKLVKTLTDYDEDTADEYRSEVSAEIISLIDRLRERLEADAVEVRDTVAQLQEIERKYENADAFKELDEIKGELEESKHSVVPRFRDTDARDAILQEAIVSIHWRTIRKMNSLYGTPTSIRRLPRRAGSALPTSPDQSRHMCSGCSLALRTRTPRASQRATSTSTS